MNDSSLFASPDNRYWGSLFRRILGTEPLSEVEAWCEDHGLAKHAWLDATWVDPEGHAWSAVSRIGFLWVNHRGISRFSLPTLEAALAYGIGSSGWNQTQPGEPDVVWAWLGSLAQGAYPDSLAAAFEDAPRLPGNRAACGHGDDEGWMAQAFAMAHWAQEQLLSVSDENVALFDRLVSSWSNGLLWQTHLNAVDCPWVLGPGDSKRVFRHFVDLAQEEVWVGPKEIREEGTRNRVWLNMARLHITLANRGLLDNASLLDGLPRGGGQDFFFSLSPLAQQAGWELIQVETARAVLKNGGFRKETCQLCAGLAPVSTPANWKEFHWKGFEKVLGHWAGVPYPLSSMVRENLLSFRLPLASAPHAKPRF